MAEITRRRMGELVRGVFAALSEQPDGLPAAAVLKIVEAKVPPTPFEQSYYPKSPNVRRFEKIVRFGTIPAVKAGWLLKSKGQWSLTDDGRTALATFTDPEAFQREAIKLYGAWKEGQPPPPEPNEETLEKETASTFEEAEEAAWAEIRDYLATMPPYDFQNLVAALLKAMN